jgi:hypothetical protein
MEREREREREKLKEREREIERERERKKGKRERKKKRERERYHSFPLHESSSQAKDLSRKKSILFRFGQKIVLLYMRHFNMK